MSGLVLLLLGLLAAPSPSPPPSPAFERKIEARGAARMAVRLDREVYEGARADLGDLRILDDTGALAPFVLDRGQRRCDPAPPRPVIRNRGWRGDRALSAVLDFGRRTRKPRLQLELSGDNFRRRVAVEGSDDGENWVTLVDEAWVFAVPGDPAARYETVALPENDFPYLRVTVRPGDGEQERVELTGASLPGAEPPVRERLLTPGWTIAEVVDARETRLTVDLGARHQPFHAVELAIEDGRFFREVRVEARRDPATTASPVQWVEVGRGVLYRIEHDSRRRESLRLEVSGRERALRLRIRNADDRPLKVVAVEVRVPVERLAFEAAAGRSYRLAYGAPLRAPAAFDLARTIEDPVAWVDGALEVALGPVRLVPPEPGGPLPWTERHPRLLWAGLVAVVFVLGALTFQALRSQH